MVPADAGGVSLGKREDKMGQRSTDTREVIFEEVRIPSRFRLGEGRDGFKIAMETLDASRPVVGSQAVGIARAAFETALAYVKQQTLSDRPVVASQGTELKRRDCCAGTRLGLAITVTVAGNNRQSRSASRPISLWK
jgi:alkylation response protein AidB-like acyl-CoA dehydrogenase